MTDVVTRATGFAYPDAYGRRSSLLLLLAYAVYCRVALLIPDSENSSRIYNFEMKTNVVNYTPIPAQVPRALAIQILHSHGEIITLNPLVLEYHPIKPPRDAPNDEYYSTWYEIVERIKFVPGIGSMGSSKVSFRGVFHDMPWGIQTHMYVPMGIELRHKWQVRGNQPGEPTEPREIGSKAPSSGLYLQENVEITSNPLAISFVKKELKAASKVMIDRMMRKAELVDAGVLQAMFEDGKLKTLNPSDRSSTYGAQPPTPNMSRWSKTQSMVSSGSRTSSYGGPFAPSTNSYSVPSTHGPSIAIEMLGDTHFPAQQSRNAPNDTRRMSVQSELHGDTHHAPGEDSRYSFVSSSDDRSSNQSRPSSFYPSPAVNQGLNMSELPTSHNRPQSRSPPRPAPIQQHPSHSSGLTASASPQPPPQQPRYNPQDYARFSGARYA